MNVCAWRVTVGPQVVFVIKSDTAPMGKLNILQITSDFSATVSWCLWEKKKSDGTMSAAAAAAPTQQSP